MENEELKTGAKSRNNPVKPQKSGQGRFMLKVWGVFKADAPDSPNEGYLRERGDCVTGPDGRAYRLFHSRLYESVPEVSGLANGIGEIHVYFTSKKTRIVKLGGEQLPGGKLRYDVELHALTDDTSIIDALEMVAMDVNGWQPEKAKSLFPNGSADAVTMHTVFLKSMAGLSQENLPIEGGKAIAERKKRKFKVAFVDPKQFTEELLRQKLTDLQTEDVYRLMAFLHHRIEGNYDGVNRRILVRASEIATVALGNRSAKTIARVKAAIDTLDSLKVWASCKITVTSKKGKKQEKDWVEGRKLIDVKGKEPDGKGLYNIELLPGWWDENDPGTQIPFALLESKRSGKLIKLGMLLKVELHENTGRARTIKESELIPMAGLSKTYKANPAEGRKRLKAMLSELDNTRTCKATQKGDGWEVSLY